MRSQVSSATHTSWVAREEFAEMVAKSSLTEAPFSTPFPVSLFADLSYLGLEIEPRNGSDSCGLRMIFRLEVCTLKGA